MNVSMMKRAAPVPPAAAVRRSLAAGEVDGSITSEPVVHASSTASMASQSRRSSIDETFTLTVLLPNGESHPFPVNRRMPLMDLLVHAAAVHKFNPSEYAVYNPQARFQSSLLPNTPVGELGTEVVQIVPKNSAVLNTMSNNAKFIKASSVRTSTMEQPFEKTFRLQINLPQQQKMILRASPKQTLQDVLGEICAERNLDVRLYTLRNPQHPAQPLEMHRLLVDQATKEISLVSVSQEINAQDSRKFGNLTKVTVEPPDSPLADQRRFGMNIFKMCRKKRMSSKDLSVSSSHGSKREFPLRSGMLSRSMADLMPAAESAVPVKPTRSGKKAAPRPPSVVGGTLANGQTSYTAMEKAQRTRHHSESSGYDESLVLSNSPERDGGSVDEASGGAGGGSAPVRVPVSARSSTSTPDSGLKSVSELVSKSAHVSKKKAPAPPPPPPTSGSGDAVLSSSPIDPNELQTEVRSRAPSSVSAASTSDKISLGGSTGGSLSNKSINSSIGNKDYARHGSSDTIRDAVPAINAEKPSLDQVDQESDTMQTASFVFESGSQRSGDSVAEQDFDSESSIDSLEIQPIDVSTKRFSISDVDVEVHMQPDNGRIDDWDYRMPREAVSLRRSFPITSDTDGGFWVSTNATVVRIGEDIDQISPSGSVGVQGGSVEPPGANTPQGERGAETIFRTPVEQSSTNSDFRKISDSEKKSKEKIEEFNSGQEEERPRSLGTPPAFKGLFSPSSATSTSRHSAVHRNISDSSESEQIESSDVTQKDISGVSTPDSGIHSQHASLKEPLKSPEILEVMADKPKIAPADSQLKLVIPPPGKNSTSLPSPSPSNASISSLQAPALPVSTPPPVIPKTQQPVAAVFTRRPSAQVSISSIADEKPDRYKDMVAQQPGVAALPIPSSKEELLKEIRAVQEDIASLQSQIQVVQLHSKFTPEELADVSEKQGILQEHIQKQIALTQRLLQNESGLQENSSPKFATVSTPAVSAKPLIPTKSFISEIQQPIKLEIRTATELRNYGAPIVVPGRKIPVVTKLSGSSIVPVSSPPNTTNSSPSPARSTVSDDVLRTNDVLRTTRPKMQHRDSWLAEASRRFDFSQPNSTGDNSLALSASPVLDRSSNSTKTPVPDVRSAGVVRVESKRLGQTAPVIISPARSSSSPTRAPLKSEENIPRNVTAARNFTANLNRNPSQTTAIQRTVSNKFIINGTDDTMVDPDQKQKIGYPLGNFSGSGSVRRTPSVDAKSSIDDKILKSGYPLGNFSGSGSVRRTPSVDAKSSIDDKIPKSGYPSGNSSGSGPVSAALRSSAERSTVSVKARPVSQIIARNVEHYQGETESMSSLENSGDFMSSIVRSWKNGTPTPYHHVNVGPRPMVGRPAEAGHRTSVASGEVPIPPPPPSPPASNVTAEFLRNVSVPSSKALSGNREVKSISRTESEPNQRAQLCDAIKTFSLGSLKKVPTAAHKSWVPKIR